MRIALEKKVPLIFWGEPSAEYASFYSYSEDEEEPDPTQSVYPFVPVSVVSLVLAKHGGMVGGEVPAGVAALRAPE